MMFNHGRLPTPFGGPASGLWPNGGGGAPPPPPPPLPCLHADIFSDLFGGCSGVISPGSPGPICGWTYFMSVLGAPGTITFGPGSMRFDCSTSFESPAASKGIILPTLTDRTLQFVFQEFPDVSASLSYILNITDAANANILSLTLGGNEDVDIVVGPQSNANIYEGNWTPEAGARHTVRLTVDGAGVPRLWIDGAEIPLLLIQTGIIFSGYAAQTITAIFSDFDGPGPAVSSTLESLFIATGQIPPTRTFCRP